MAKKLLAAGYVRDLQFDTAEALELYLYDLNLKNLQHKILDKFERADGSIIIRILQQYNNAPLIELYDNL